LPSPTHWFSHTQWWSNPGTQVPHSAQCFDLGIWNSITSNVSRNNYNVTNRKVYSSLTNLFCLACVAGQALYKHCTVERIMVISLLRLGCNDTRTSITCQKERTLADDYSEKDAVGMVGVDEIGWEEWLAHEEPGDICPIYYTQIQNLRYFIN
jgi:hypothetical protein